MAGKINSKVLWITETAIFIALLVVVQYATQSFGQLVTGSAVNFLLVAAALTVNLGSGLTIAVLSPILAKLLGIGPLWSFVPVIALGNAVIVAVFALMLGKAGGLKGLKKYLLWVLTIIIGAGAKFLVIWLGILKIVVPVISGTLKAPQIEKFSQMFSLPQLFTALIGGAVAMLIVPAIKFALKRK